MEKFIENVSDAAIWVVGIPLVVIFVGWAINVIHIMWVLGDKLERFIGEKIDKKIYNEHERLRREIDGG